VLRPPLRCPNRLLSMASTVPPRAWPGISSPTFICSSHQLKPPWRSSRHTSYNSRPTSPPISIFRPLCNPLPSPMHSLVALPLRTISLMCFCNGSAVIPRGWSAAALMFGLSPDFLSSKSHLIYRPTGPETHVLRLSGFFTDRRRWL